MATKTAGAQAPAPAPSPPAMESRPVFGSEPESTMPVDAVSAEPSNDVVDLAGAEADEPPRLASASDEAPAWNAAGDADQAWSPEPAGGWGASDDFGGSGASAGDEYAAESLDDDAFFASLRDAVRDDEPLGPRDDGFYDDEDAEAGKKLFRRRR